MARYAVQNHWQQGLPLVTEWERLYPGMQDVVLFLREAHQGIPWWTLAPLRRDDLDELERDFAKARKFFEDNHPTLAFMPDRILFVLRRELPR